MKMRILNQWVEDGFAWVEAFDLETGEIFVMTGHLRIVEGMKIEWTK